ncbi:MAG: hypothetical protein ACJ8AK_11510 [Gemmatimonadaceae bacterium]
MAFWTKPLLLVVPVVTAASSPAVEGTYVATTLNGRALPTDLRIPVQQGDVRLFRLEQGILRLDGHGNFLLYFRYYHQLVRRGAKPVATPVMAESEKGTYRKNGNKLILVPQRKKNGKSRPTIAASVSGEEVSAFYVLDDGVTHQPVALVLRRDPAYW